MNKTGTSTMKACFEQLGWTPVASPKTVPRGRRMYLDIFEREDYSRALDTAPPFMAFEDRPWNVWEMYRHLDERFPASRFILTVRDPQDWWQSVHTWLTRKKPQMVETYTTHLRADTFSRVDFVSGYERYNAEVARYFDGSDRFVVLDVTHRARWDDLCAFLDAPVPDVAFPHRNRQRQRPD